MTIRDSILAIVKENFTSNQARVAKVTAVDEATATCTVVTLDTETKLFEVRLQASVTNGLLMIPAADSFVIIDALSDVDFVVVMFSAIDTIKMLDGSFGGLTKTQELKTQLDKTNAVVEALVNSLTGFTPVPNDGGAALKAYASGQLAGKTVGDFSGIENDKITHGTV